MERKKISIVVPIYNSEKFLSNCIESILNQNFQDYELLLINDGSTDSSLSICQKYFESNRNKIKLFNNNNYGCSISRNFGIEKAQGKYIVFIDSDDWIEKDMLYDMYQLAEKEESDVVLSGAFYEYIDEKISIVSIPEKTEESFFWFKDKNLVSMICSKLWRLDLIKEKNIRFNPKIKLAEDFVFNVSVLLEAKKISVLGKADYHYVLHDNNSVFNVENRKDIFKAQEIIYNKILKKTLGNDSNLKLLMTKCFIAHIKSGITKLMYAKSYKEFRTFYMMFKENIDKAPYLSVKDKKNIHIRRYIIFLCYIFNFKFIFKLKRLFNGLFV